MSEIAGPTLRDQHISTVWKVYHRTPLWGCIFFLLMVAPFLVYGCYVVDRQWRLSNWPATKALVLSYDPGIHPMAGEMQWYARPSISFEYSVNGVQYQSTRLNPSPFNYLIESQFRRDMQNINVRGVVDCWYNPSNREEAYIVNAGVTTGPALILAIASALIGWMAWVQVTRRCRLFNLTIDGRAMTRSQLCERIDNASPHVRALCLAHCELGSEIIQALNRCRKLICLRLYESRLDDNTLNKIQCISHLKELGIESNPITDQSMSILASYDRLSCLGLAFTEIGDEGLSSLPNLSKLRFLDIEGTAVTDAGTRTIAQIKSLLEVNLASTRISDLSIEYISQLPRLRRLDVRNTEITDASATQLIALLGRDGFEKIRVEGSKMSARAMRMF